MRRLESAGEVLRKFLLQVKRSAQASIMCRQARVNGLDCNLATADYAVSNGLVCGSVVSRAKDALLRGLASLFTRKRRRHAAQAHVRTERIPSSETS